MHHVVLATLQLDLTAVDQSAIKQSLIPSLMSLIDQALVSVSMILTAGINVVLVYRTPMMQGAANGVTHSHYLTGLT